MKPFISSTEPTFEQVYNLYFQRVLSYLKSVVGENDAEDIAQETFVKVHKNLNQLKDMSKLTAWIFKIALNTARDNFRKESKNKKLQIKGIDCHSGNIEMKLDYQQINDKNAYSVEEKIFKREMMDCYFQFVKKLPENYHRVYILSEFMGLSNSEISSHLSISVETVKIRLHRAKSKLYEILRTHCVCFHNEHGEIQAGLKE